MRKKIAFVAGDERRRREDDMVVVMGRCGRPGKRPSGMRTRRDAAVLALMQRKRTGADNQLSLVGSGRRCTARRCTVKAHVSLESGGLESLACPFMAGHVLRAVGHVLRAASSRLLASCV